MAETWQTIEQAAVTLKISVRTVNRHIVAGKLPSRLSAEGRREVLVPVSENGDRDTIESPFCDLTDPNLGVLTDVPLDPPAKPSASVSAAPIQAPQSEPASHLPVESSQSIQASNNGSASFDAETILALADNAAQKAELAVAAYQALARVADTQVQQVRRGARVAWAAVAVMGLGVAGAVAWGSHWMTRASAEIDYLKYDVATGSRQVKEISNAGEALRTQMASAEQELRNQLAAAKAQAAHAEGKLAAYQEMDDARQTRETLASLIGGTEAATVLNPLPTLDSAPPASLPTSLPSYTVSTEDIFSPTPADEGSAGSSDTDATDGSASVPTGTANPDVSATSDAPTAQSASAPEKAQESEALVVHPTSRPATLHRKVLIPTTRPSLVTDSQSDIDAR